MLVRHLLVLGTVLAGCDSTTPTARPDELAAAITDGQAEGDLYVADVHALSTMPAIADEVARHQARMVEIFGTLDTSMHTMTHCMDTTVMSGDRTGLIVDLQMHVSVMRTQTTLYGARLEVDRHVNASDAMFADMQAVLDGNAPCPN